MPAVSVIIPNYNHGAFLKERIDSVLNQTFTDYEVIILDDASTDNSKEIIEEYSLNPKISHIIYNENNSGSPFKQWAKGIALAKADWIWIAESDDSCSIEFLKTMVTLISNSHEISIAYSDAVYIDEAYKRFSLIKNRDFSTSKWLTDYELPGSQELTENLAYVCTINNASATIFRKDFILDVAKELNDFRFHGDWYVYIRLALKGKIIYNSSALCQVRMHAQSHLNLKKEIGRRKEEYFKILLLLLKNTPLRKKELIQFFASQYLNFSFSQLTKVPFKYLTVNFGIGLKVLWHILIVKIKGLKPKNYFD